MGVIVVVEVVERHARLPTAADRPVEDSAGEEDLVSSSCGGAGPLVAGEIALGVVGAELEAQVVPGVAHGGAEVQALVKAEITAVAQVGRGAEPVHSAEDREASHDAQAPLVEVEARGEATLLGRVVLA